MKFNSHRLAAVLSAAVFAGFAASAFAGGEPVGPHGFGGHGPGAPGPDMPVEEMQGMHGMHGMMGRLHGLNLSEAQQDKLFAIHHAAEPEGREHRKAIRKAHEALAELAQAERFDGARAATLSRELGQAIAAEALLQARTHAQALAVLTSEQREQLRRHRTPGRERAE
jgi:protein CpxP